MNISPSKIETQQKLSIRDRVLSYADALREALSAQSGPIEGTELELLDFYIQLLDVLTKDVESTDDLHRVLQLANACEEEALSILPGVPLGTDNHNLLLLGIPLFFDHLEQLKTLHDRGVPLDRQDARGYTVLHIAAMLQKKEAYNWLVAQGANENRESQDGSTPKDLLEAGSPDNTTLFTQDSLLSFWIDSTIAIAEPFAQRLRDTRPEVDALHAHLNESISPAPENYLEKRNVEALGENGLFAKQDITAGFCFEFSGVFDTNLPLSGDTSHFRYINTTNTNSLGTAINDGLPNCKFITTLVNGLPKVLVLALRDIATDEQLLVNYGYGHRAKGWDDDHTHLELQDNALQQLQDFTQDFTRYISLDEQGFLMWDMPDQRTPLSSDRPVIEQWLQLLRFQEFFHYALATPDTLIRLALQENLSISKTLLNHVMQKHVQQTSSDTHPFLAQSHELLQGLSALQQPDSGFSREELLSFYKEHSVLEFCTHIAQKAPFGL